MPEASNETTPPIMSTSSTSAPQEEKSELLERIADLERRDAENQKKLEMLYAVADKGRLFNYENKVSNKAPLRVKLSKWNGGVVVGWRTVKDELVLDPRTGSIAGEIQQYEVLVLGDDGSTTKHAISGYENFSNARYNERVECEVVSKSEDYEGRVTFHISLPDGRRLDLGSQFIN